jgi:hypothetical protein
MRGSFAALVLAAGMVVLAPGARAACTDPDAPAVRDRILAACPCEGNHGQYVRCVAHAVKDAVRSGELDVNCKGKVTRCAARSTCGHKSGFVTCTLCEPGTCTGGLCDDGVTACDELTPCPAAVRRCSKKSDESRCVVPPGAPAGSTVVVSTGSCCHASCAAAQ